MDAPDAALLDGYAALNDPARRREVERRGVKIGRVSAVRPWVGCR